MTKIYSPIEQSRTKNYKALQRSIAFIGILLPIVLVFGHSFVQGDFQIKASLSAYYHTDFRNYFVGSMCVIGIFLWFYAGYDKIDDGVGNLACLFALGVAFCPTNSPIDVPYCLVTFPPTSTIHYYTCGIFPQNFATIHYIFASLFIASLAFFCLCLFTKTGGEPPTAQKRIRNRIYIVCGVIITLVIAILLACRFALPSESFTQYKLIFWGEIVAIVSFAFSWLVKGEALPYFNDFEDDKEVKLHD